MSPSFHPKQKCTYAVASLILGCCSVLFLFLTGIPAIICALISFARQQKNPDLRGQAFAIAGIVLGGLSLALSLFVFIVLLAFFSHRMNSNYSYQVRTDLSEQITLNIPENQEVSDIRQAGLLLFQYANRHKGHYPDSIDELFADKYYTDSGKTGLFYRNDKRAPRWILTPGLSTQSPLTEILLRSSQPVDAGHSRGTATFSVGNLASWVEE